MDRDIANLKHFVSRSQQPKILTSKSKVLNQSSQRVTPTPAKPMFINDDQHKEEFDALRFLHVGTSPKTTSTAKVNNRHNMQRMMKSTDMPHYMW